MDIAQIAAEVAQDEEVITVTMMQKSGEPYLAADGSDATISVVGADSKRVKAADDAVQRRLLRRRQRRLEPQDLRDNRIAIASAAIMGWHGWESGGGEWPCVPENAKVLLTADHILVQVEEAVNQPRNFSPKSLGT